MKTSVSIVRGVLLPAAVAASLVAPGTVRAAEADPLFGLLLIDQLEYRWNEGTDSTNWNAQGWFGGDYNRVWLKTDGTSLSDGTVEEAEGQLLYSRLIAPFWDFQAGLRYDEKPKPSRSYAVLGVQGLAPYWFELEAAAFVSEKGDVSARLEAEYDLLLTQRLIVQPRFETTLVAQKVEELGIGHGFSDVELGLRLRYEIRREFAPYVGVSWARKLGDTADFARQAGEDADNFAVVAGVRVWF
jgi:copper resistance protein B